MHVREGVADEGGEVAGEGEVGVGGVEVLAVGGEGGAVELLELALDLVGDREVVEAGWEVRQRWDDTGVVYRPLRGLCCYTLAADPP